MFTSSILTGPHKIWLRVLWGISVLIALMSWRFLMLPMDIAMPDMVHHALDRPIWFYAHVGFAPVALAVLPLQFSARLRQKRRGMHRWTGRLYGVAVLLAGLGGIPMALNAPSGAVSTWGFGLLSVLWMFTTLVAVRFAIRRDIERHRRWMIRSAALTLAAVTLRIYLPIGFAFFDPATAYHQTAPYVAWACWVPNLLLAEWILRKPLRNRKARSETGA